MTRGDFGPPPGRKPQKRNTITPSLFISDIAGTTKLETNDFNKLSIPLKLLRVLDELDFILPTTTQSSLIPVVHDPKGGGKFAIRAKPGTGKSTSIALLTLMSLLRDKSTKTYINGDSESSFYFVIVRDKHSRLEMIRLLTQLSTFCPDLSIEPKDLKSTKPAVLVKGIQDAIHLLRNKIINPAHVKTVAVDEVDEVFKNAPQKDINAMFKYIISNQTNKGTKLLFVDNYFSNHTIDCFREWKTDMKTINVTPTDLIKFNMEHFVKFVSVRNRKAICVEVAELVANDPTAQAVVYCNEDREIDALFDYLTIKGETCIVMKPSMNKELLRKKIKGFQMGRASVLISHNFVNSGIKCSNVKFIVNVGIVEVHDYYFNTAVTGDRERKRYVVNLMDKGKENEKRMGEVEREYNIKIKELK